MATERTSWNVALWIAAVPVTLAALRIMMFSRGDPTLLRVLLETVQVLPILIATTLQLIPWMVVTVGILLLLNASARRVAGAWLARSRLLMLAAIFCVFIVLYVSPVGVAISILTVYTALLALFILARVPKNWARRIVKVANKLDYDDPLSSLITLLILPLILTQMSNWNAFWLPREAVTVSSEAIDAYVLNVTGEWTTLLTPGREVLRFPTDDVTSRLVCDQGESPTFLMLGAETISEPSECSN